MSHRKPHPSPVQSPPSTETAAPTSAGPAPEATGCLPLAARMFWLLFGNIALLVFAGQVANRKAPVVMDLLFFATAASLVLVRYLDVTRFHGHTADGKPASLADWGRHTAFLSLAALALWGLARLAAARGWV